ncbi:MAG: hypothetical protein U5R06_09310 [candidate division KSB1 bacterium]|nr:hypothetical protein [candidate division KSB1 bacterium]
MQKKYKLSPRENWYIILVFSSIPLVRLLMERTLSLSLLVQVLVYMLASTAIVVSRSQVIAEIKDNTLHVYNGIGLSDPDHLQLSRISGTQRVTSRLLNIQYEGRTLSVEGYKKVLDKVEADLNAITQS